MLGANATTMMPPEPPTRPMTIHGRLIPNRDDVRSLSLPKHGLPTIATSAPMAATSARLSGARLMPTSELTFSAKVTSKGAMNTRQVLMYARVYSEMNRHPTRLAAGGPGPIAPPAAVGYGQASSPTVGGSRRSLVAGRPPGPGTSGIAPVQVVEEPVRMAGATARHVPVVASSLPDGVTLGVYELSSRRSSVSSSSWRRGPGADGLR